MFTSIVSRRTLLAVLCVPLTLSACGHHTNGAAAAQPSAPLDAESLLVSINELRQIIGVPDLSKMSDLSIEPHVHAGNVPPSCRVVTDRDVTFGQAWTQFKGVLFGVVEGRNLESGTQAVVVYPDDATARAAFTQLLTSLQQCSETHWEVLDNLGVEFQDPSSFATHHGGHYALYRIRDNVLIEIDIYQLPDTERVAQTIMRTISDRISGA